MSRIDHLTDTDIQDLLDRLREAERRAEYRAERAERAERRVRYLEGVLKCPETELSRTREALRWALDTAVHLADCAVDSDRGRAGPDAWEFVARVRKQIVERRKQFFGQRKEPSQGD